MSGQLTTPSLLIWLAVLGTGALSVVVYRRRPPAPLWPVLLYAYLAAFLWAVGEAVTSLLVTSSAEVWPGTVVQYTGILALPATWWLFGLRFAELHGRPLEWAGRVVSHGPLGVAVFFWLAMVTNPLHGWFLEPSLHQRAHYEVLWYAQATCGYALMLGVVGLFLRLRTQVPKLRLQVDILIAGSLIPLVCNVLYVTNGVDLGFGLTAVGLAVSALLFFIGIYRDRLFALSPASLQYLVEHESDGMLLLDPHGQLLHSNPAAARLLGVDRLAPNTPVFPLLAQRFASGSDGETVSAEQLARELGSSEENTGAQLYSYGPLPGRWMSIEAILVPGWRGRTRGIGLHLRDLTHLIKVRQTVDKQASALEAILGSAEQGLLVIDMNGRMVYWNNTLLEMWTIPDELLDAADERRLLAHAAQQLADPDAFLPEFHDLLSTSKVEGREELRRRDGRIFERSSRPLIREGELVGRVWSFWDVSDDRQAREDTKQLELRIADAQRMESLGLLAGGIAHDFNNLLAGIMGSADLALRLVLPERELRECLTDIVDASRQAAGLTRQMLDYAGKGRFVVEPIDLSRLVQETAHLLEAVVSKSAKLEFELGEIPLIEGDETQLRQVAMNLILNASESLDGKPGLLRVATRVIDADEELLAGYRFGELLTEGSYVSLAVADTGCGMDAGTVAKIFEPFFTTKFMGRGLGLASSLGIIQSHGGGFRVESQLGRGTTMQVLLPVAGSEPSQTQGSSADRCAEPVSILHTRGLSELRGEGLLLVVDDEIRVLRVALRAFEAAGFQVLTAGDGSEAVRVASLRGGDIMAVLLDVTMPGLSGLETYCALKKLCPEAPIVLSSGHPESNISKQFGDVEPDGFIQKPYKTVELVEQVDRVLELRRRRRTRESFGGTPGSGDTRLERRVDSVS